MNLDEPLPPRSGRTATADALVARKEPAAQNVRAQGRAWDAPAFVLGTLLTYTSLALLSLDAHRLYVDAAARGKWFYFVAACVCLGLPSLLQPLAVRGVGARLLHLLQLHLLRDAWRAVSRLRRTDAEREEAVRRYAQTKAFDLLRTVPASVLLSYAVLHRWVALSDYAGYWSWLDGRRFGVPVVSLLAAGVALLSACSTLWLLAERQASRVRKTDAGRRAAMYVYVFADTSLRAVLPAAFLVATLERGAGGLRWLGIAGAAAGYLTSLGLRLAFVRSADASDGEREPLRDSVASALLQSFTEVPVRVRLSCRRGPDGRVPEVFVGDDAAGAPGSFAAQQFCLCKFLLGVVVQLALLIASLVVKDTPFSDPDAKPAGGQHFDVIPMPALVSAFIAIKFVLNIDQGGWLGAFGRDSLFSLLVETAKRSFPRARVLLATALALANTVLAALLAHDCHGAAEYAHFGLLVAFAALPYALQILTLARSAAAGVEAAVTRRLRLATFLLLRLPWLCVAVVCDDAASIDRRKLAAFGEVPIDEKMLLASKSYYSDQFAETRVLHVSGEMPVLVLALFKLFDGWKVAEGRAGGSALLVATVVTCFVSVSWTLLTYSLRVHALVFSNVRALDSFILVATYAFCDTALRAGAFAAFLAATVGSHSTWSVGSRVLGVLGVAAAVLVALATHATFFRNMPWQARVPTVLLSMFSDAPLAFRGRGVSPPGALLEADEAQHSGSVQRSVSASGVLDTVQFDGCVHADLHVVDSKQQKLHVVAKAIAGFAVSVLMIVAACLIDGPLEPGSEGDAGIYEFYQIAVPLLGGILTFAKYVAFIFDDGWLSAFAGDNEKDITALLSQLFGALFQSWKVALWTGLSYASWGRHRVGAGAGSSAEDTGAGQKQRDFLHRFLWPRSHVSLPASQIFGFAAIAQQCVVFLYILCDLVLRIFVIGVFIAGMPPVFDAIAVWRDGYLGSLGGGLHVLSAEESKIHYFFDTQHESTARQFMDTKALEALGHIVNAMLMCYVGLRLPPLDTQSQAQLDAGKRLLFATFLESQAAEGETSEKERGVEKAMDASNWQTTRQHHAFSGEKTRFESYGPQKFHLCAYQSGSVPRWGRPVFVVLNGSTLWWYKRKEVAERGRVNKALGSHRITAGSDVATGEQLTMIILTNGEGVVLHTPDSAELDRLGGSVLHNKRVLTRGRAGTDTDAHGGQLARADHTDVDSSAEQEARDIYTVIARNSADDEERRAEKPACGSASTGLATAVLLLCALPT
eukprot:g3033.t1